MNEDRILTEAMAEMKNSPTLGEMLELGDLKEQPGWKYLAERMSRIREATMQTLSRKLLAGVKVSEEEIAYQRGYVRGVIDSFTYPERLEKEFERAAERAYARAQERLSEEDGEEPTTPGG